MTVAIARSEAARPYAAVVRALAWHLRVGGVAKGSGGATDGKATEGACGRCLGLLHWRTAYGWFRRWQERGLIDALRHVVGLRRRAGGTQARAVPGRDRHAVRQCIPMAE